MSDFKFDEFILDKENPSIVFFWLTAYHAIHNGACILAFSSRQIQYLRKMSIRLLKNLSFH
jgi:hypothetical protein